MDTQTQMHRYRLEKLQYKSWRCLSPTGRVRSLNIDMILIIMMIFVQ